LHPVVGDERLAWFSGQNGNSRRTVVTERCQMCRDQGYTLQAVCAHGRARRKARPLSRARRYQRLCERALDEMCGRGEILQELRRQRMSSQDVLRVIEADRDLTQR
jgi:hypothetical protein